MGISVPTVAGAAAGRFGGSSKVRSAATGTCEAITSEEIAEACGIAASVDTCVVVVGDNAGLFGRGTSGEGNDAADLRLPGDQHEMLDRVLAAAAAAGTRTIVVVLSGRPYALGGFADRADAVVQGFFPGEEGAGALWDVLTGVVNFSGKLPVSVPRTPGGQPGTYLHSRLAGPTGVSALDPSPLFGFGHGLSYTSFEFSAHVASAPTVATTSGTMARTTAVTGTSHRCFVLMALAVRTVGAAPIAIRPQPVAVTRPRTAPGRAATRTAWAIRRWGTVARPGRWP